MNFKYQKVVNKNGVNVTLIRFYELTTMYILLKFGLVFLTIGDRVLETRCMFYNTGMINTTEN